MLIQVLDKNYTIMKWHCYAQNIYFTWMVQLYVHVENKMMQYSTAPLYGKLC